MELTREELEKLKKNLSENLKNFRETFCSGSDTLPIDIFKILERMGFEVYYGDLGKFDGAMLIDEDVNFIEEFNTNKIMVVNSKLSYKSSVFTLAHELAHFLAYKWINPGKKMQVEFREHTKKGIRNETENFMDYVAASILMPEDIFKGVLAQKEIFSKEDVISADIIDSIADKFEVDFEAARRRIGEVLQ